MSTTYTLRGAAGNKYHFARVTVEKADSLGATQPELESYQIWLNAASKGAAFALAVMKSDSSIILLEVLANDADSREHTVFAAAAMATFEAFGDFDREVLYVNDRWYVV